MADTLSPWPPRNDQIVLLALTGVPTTEIGAQFGMSQRNVQLIFNDPRANEIKKIAKARFQEKLIETIEEELDVASKLALKVIKRTLAADISPFHKAKSNQDRVAIKTLEGRGFLRSEDRGSGIGYQVTPDQFNKLMTALGKADEAKDIDPFEVPQLMPAEIVESDEDEEGEEDVA
jgi:hypothetical protein